MLGLFLSTSLFIGERDRQNRVDRAARDAENLIRQGLSRQEAIEKASLSQNVNPEDVSRLRSESVEFEREPREYVSEGATQPVEVEGRPGVFRAPTAEERQIVEPGRTDPETGEFIPELVGGKRIRGSRQFVETKVREAQLAQQVPTEQEITPEQQRVKETLERQGKQVEVTSRGELRVIQDGRQTVISRAGEIVRAPETATIRTEFVRGLERQRERPPERQKIQEEPDMFGGREVTVAERPKGFFARAQVELEKTRQEQARLERERGFRPIREPFLIAKGLGLSLVTSIRPFVQKAPQIRAGVVAFVAQPTREKFRLVGQAISTTALGVGETLRTRPISTIGEAALFTGITRATQFGAERVAAGIQTARLRAAGTTTTQLARVVETRPSAFVRDIDVRVKPLQRLDVVQVQRDTQIFQRIRPIVGKEVTVPLKELIKQPKVAAIDFETTLAGRITPRGAPPTTLPARPGVTTFDLQRAGRITVPTERLDVFLQARQIGRVQRVTLPEQVGQVRLIGKGKAFIRPLELAETREVFAGFKRPGKPTFGTTEFTTTPEFQRQIGFVPKLPGKAPLITESGKLLGIRRFGVGGEVFEPAPRGFDIQVTKPPSAPIVGRITQIQAKPTKVQPFIERPTSEGLVTLQKVKTEPKLKTKVVTEQKLKQDVATVQKQRTKAEVKTKQEVKIETISKSKQFQKIEQVSIQKPVSLVAVVPATIQSPSLSTIQLASQKSKQIPKQIAEQLPKQKPAQIPEQIPLQEVKPIQATTPQIKSLTVQELVPQFPRPDRPFTEAPTRPKQPRILLPRLKAREKTKQTQAFEVQVRRFGEFRTVAKELPIGRALKFGAELTQRTLAATFRIVPKGETKIKDIPFKPSKEIFREFKISKGDKIPTPKTFIEKRKFRLSASPEVTELKGFRRRA